MFFVNIIHKECNLIEYAVLETFLRFFGVSVYNSCYEELTDTFFNEKLDMEEVERINIVIVNAEEDIEEFTKNTSHSQNIFVSAYKKVMERDEAIAFPARADGDEYREFLEAILQRIVVMSGRSVNERLRKDGAFIEQEKNQLIEMFLEFDIVRNWYIPIRVYRERRSVAQAIINLNNCLDKHSSSEFEYIERPHIYYAYIHTKYMVNRMCAKANFINIIPWEELFADAEKLSVTVATQKRAHFLLGEIYDESGKNNMLADHFYTSARDSADYYILYRHARLNEFRLNDKAEAKALFEKSTQYNPNYYRSLYKLAMYSDENNEYEQAFSIYNRIVALLYKRFAAKHWTITDLEYMIKSCGRIMGLNRYFKSEMLMQGATEKIDFVMQSTDKNKFFREISEFISKNKEDAEQLRNKMIEDIKGIANKHIQDFCRR